MSGEQMIHPPAKYCNSQRFIRSFSDWRAALSASVAEMLSACSREPHWAQLGYLSGWGVSFEQYSHMPADWHVIVVVCDRLESVLFLTPGQLARRVVLPSSQSRVRVQSTVPTSETAHRQLGEVCFHSLTHWDLCSISNKRRGTQRPSGTQDSHWVKHFCPSNDHTADSHFFFRYNKQNIVEILVTFGLIY